MQHDSWMILGSTRGGRDARTASGEMPQPIRDAVGRAASHILSTFRAASGRYSTCRALPKSICSAIPYRHLQVSILINKIRDGHAIPGPRRKLAYASNSGNFEEMPDPKRDPRLNTLVMRPIICQGEDRVSNESHDFLLGCQESRSVSALLTRKDGRRSRDLGMDYCLAPSLFNIECRALVFTAAHDIKTITAANCGAAPAARCHRCLGKTNSFQRRSLILLGLYRFIPAKSWQPLASKGDGAARSGRRGTYEMPPPRYGGARSAYEVIFLFMSVNPSTQNRRQQVTLLS